MNNMPTFKKLIKDNNTIWFFCKNESLAKSFLEKCENEGFLALNRQKPTELFRHKFYGIFDDMTMGYLTSMIWSLTLQNANDNHIRIDYEKFISGKEDYICHSTKPQITGYDMWKQIAYSNNLKPKEFSKACDQFIEGQSFEEYNAYIFRYLTESNWHYTPEQAFQRMLWEDYLIMKCYADKTPVTDCAVEVGYGCG